MPFMRRTYLHSAPCVHCVEKVPKDNENDTVSLREFDTSVEQLASADSFDLKKRLDAGVALDQVNTKVIPTNLSKDDIDYIGKNIFAASHQQEQNNQEQNNKSEV